MGSKAFNKIVAIIGIAISLLAITIVVVEGTTEPSNSPKGKHDSKNPPSSKPTAGHSGKSKGTTPGKNGHQKEETKGGVPNFAAILKEAAPKVVSEFATNKALLATHKELKYAEFLPKLAEELHKIVKTHHPEITAKDIEHEEKTHRNEFKKIYLKVELLKVVHEAKAKPAILADLALQEKAPANMDIRGLVKKLTFKHAKIGFANKINGKKTKQLNNLIDNMLIELEKDFKHLKQELKDLEKVVADAKKKGQQGAASSGKDAKHAAKEVAGAHHGTPKKPPTHDASKKGSDRKPLNIATGHHNKDGTTMPTSPGKEGAKSPRGKPNLHVQIPGAKDVAVAHGSPHGTPKGQHEGKSPAGNSPGKSPGKSTNEEKSPSAHNHHNNEPPQTPTKNVKEHKKHPEHPESHGASGSPQALPKDGHHGESAHSLPSKGGHHSVANSKHQFEDYDSQLGQKSESLLGNENEEIMAGSEAADSPNSMNRAQNEFADDGERPPMTSAKGESAEEESGNAFSESMTKVDTTENEPSPKFGDAGDENLSSKFDDIGSEQRHREANDDDDDMEGERSPHGGSESERKPAGGDDDELLGNHQERDLDDWPESTMDKAEKHDEDDDNLNEHSSTKHKRESGTEEFGGEEAFKRMNESGMDGPDVDGQMEEANGLDEQQSPTHHQKAMSKHAGNDFDDDDEDEKMIKSTDESALPGAEHGSAVSPKFSHQMPELKGEEGENEGVNESSSDAMASGRQAENEPIESPKSAGRKEVEDEMNAEGHAGGHHGA